MVQADGRDPQLLLGHCGSSICTCGLCQAGLEGSRDIDSQGAAVWVLSQAVFWPDVALGLTVPATS